MSAYIVGEIEVHDDARYADYVAQVPALVAKHRGEYVVRGGNAESREGDWQPQRLVVIRFPSRAHAERFLDDPEYAPVKAIRHEAAQTRLVIAQGVD